MGRWIGRFWLWLIGWHIHPEKPAGYDRSVMLAVPHTSNMDLLIARAAFSVMRVPVRFTIKKEWLKPPFGWVLKPLGAIGIDRTPKAPGAKRLSMVEVMTQLFEENSGPFVILITPEGTRSRVTKWKSGFYYIAKNARVPIALGYLDYAKKEAGIGKVIWPSEDQAEDMAQIMDFYRNITPRYPAKFAIDERFG